MTSSYYDMDQNPELAGSLWTTGEDYMKFLESLYFHRALPAEVRAYILTSASDAMNACALAI